VSCFEVPTSTDQVFAGGAAFLPSEYVVLDATHAVVANAGSHSLAVVWRPAANGVNALREAANRELLLPVRNYLPIYVRAAGVEGLAEVETLASLCPDAIGRSDSAIRRLSPAEGARALRGEKICVISYGPGGSARDDPGAREALDAVAASDEEPKELLFDGRRWAVLKWGASPL